MLSLGLPRQGSWPGVDTGMLVLTLEEEVVVPTELGRVRCSSIEASETLGFSEISASMLSEGIDTVGFSVRTSIANQGNGCFYRGKIGDLSQRGVSPGIVSGVK